MPSRCATSRRSIRPSAPTVWTPSDCAWTVRRPARCGSPTSVSPPARWGHETAMRTGGAQMGRTGTRLTLVVLQAFVAFTTIFGALLVVPTLPLEWIQRGPMTDYTIPAIVLGVVCGGSALVALALLVIDSEHAGVSSMVAGAMMVAFELVE